MVSLTTFARSAGARLSEPVTAAVWGQTRRFLRLQGRLRSNEPTQILVCAVVRRAWSAPLVAGLHRLVDLAPSRWPSTSRGDHTPQHRHRRRPDAHPDRAGAGRPGAGRRRADHAALRARRRRRSDRGQRAAWRAHVDDATACACWSPPCGRTRSGVAVGMEAGYSQLGAARPGQGRAVFPPAPRRPAHLRRRRRGSGDRRGLQRAAGRRLLRLRADPRRLFGARAGAGRRRRAGRDAWRARADASRRRCSSSGRSPTFRQWFYLLFALLGVAGGGLQRAGHAIGDLGRAAAAAPAAAAMAAAGDRRRCWSAASRSWCRRCWAAAMAPSSSLFDHDLGPAGCWSCCWSPSWSPRRSRSAPAFAAACSARRCCWAACSARSSPRSLALLVPSLVGQQAALMMVGMASVAAAVIGSPLTMVFLVLEGTGNFPVTVGVMVGVVIASTIVRLTFGYSFSTWRFHQRGIGIRGPHDIGWLADLTVGPPDARRSQDRARDHAARRAAREISAGQRQARVRGVGERALSSARSTSRRCTTTSRTKCCDRRIAARLRHATATSSC